MATTEAAGSVTGAATTVVAVAVNPSQPAMPVAGTTVLTTVGTVAIVMFPAIVVPAKAAKLPIISFIVSFSLKFQFND